MDDKEILRLKTKEKTEDTVLLVVLMILIAVLGFTPAGIISFNFLTVQATILHVFVLIGAMLIGFRGGLILGVEFGLVSLLHATFIPSDVAFAFSPFVKGGSIESLLVAFVPRIACGVVGALLFKLFSAMSKKKVWPYVVSAVAGSLANTLLVLVFIGMFFSDSFVALKNVSANVMFPILMGVFGTNGIPEAVIAAIVMALIGLMDIKFRARYEAELERLKQRSETEDSTPDTQTEKKLFGSRKPKKELPEKSPESENEPEPEENPDSESKSEPETKSESETKSEPENETEPADEPADEPENESGPVKKSLRGFLDSLFGKRE